MAMLLPQCAPAPAPTAAAPPPLRLAIDQWAGFYPIVLAEELGYLREAEVKIELSIPKDTDRMLAQFAARDFDAVCASVADFVTVTRAVPDLRIALLSDESAGADQILSRTKITSAADLRGKRIGTNLGGFGELLVRRMLAHYGVSVSEVTLVNVDAANTLDRLERGDIHIGHTWEPYVSAALLRGMVASFSSKDTPGLIIDGMIVRSTTLQERAGELRGLTRAWFRAVDWWRLHPEEGDRRIEERLGLQPGQARPNGIRILDAADNRAQMCSTNGSPPLAVSLQGYIDFFAARGLLLRRPDPAVMLHTGCLP